MIRRKKSDVRRNNTRFRVPEGTFAKVKGSANKVGQMIDISKGGLAFRYIDIGERPNRSFELDMIVKNNGFHLGNVPLITTSDLEADKEFAFSSIPMRRSGGQFGELMDSQISQLEYFIQNHTIGEVKDRRSGIDRRQNNDPQYKDYERRSTQEGRIEND